MKKPKKGSLWIHTKTSCVYKVLDTRLLGNTCGHCVVYQNPFDEKIFVSPLEEFMDGRFEEIEG
jgi:hypothetical protein